MDVPKKKKSGKEQGRRDSPARDRAADPWEGLEPAILPGLVFGAKGLDLLAAPGGGCGGDLPGQAAPRNGAQLWDTSPGGSQHLGSGSF